jgi:hypothetical protein
MKSLAEIGDYVRASVFVDEYEEEVINLYCGGKGEVIIKDGTLVMIGGDKFTFFNSLPEKPPKNAVTPKVLMDGDWIYLPSL